MAGITFTLILTGTLLRYDPGVMDSVAQTQLALGHIPYVAPMTDSLTVCPCCYLGKLIGVTLPDGRVLGPKMASDCVADKDAWDKYQRGVIGEASWEMSEEIAIPLHRYVLPRDGPLDGVGFFLWPGQEEPAGVPCWPPPRPRVPPVPRPDRRQVVP